MQKSQYRMVMGGMSLLAHFISAGCVQQTSQALRQEPAPGALASGTVVYVDDGTCPSGQIKEVTGGSNISRSGQAIPGGSSRQRRCVTR